MEFASVGDVRLTLPVKDPEVVAYHQAYYSDAQSMRPIGHLTKNFYKSAFSPPPEQPGPDYLIQSPRGRGTGPTTAVDIMAPARTDVYAPIDGTVVQAKRYKLYGQYPDMIVRIRPDVDPNSQVVMIHLTNVQVHKGDEVHATLSVIGQPRTFPFHSEVNDYVPGGDPHVHIEVKDQHSSDHAPAS
jgi:murein DD-endopeptidase MepM/ murein hydrolase activator NlpD